LGFSYAYVSVGGQAQRLRAPEREQHGVSDGGHALKNFHAVAVEQDTHDAVVVTVNHEMADSMRTASQHQSRSLCLCCASQSALLWHY
jgi:hypothetical protein